MSSKVCGNRRESNNITTVNCNSEQNENPTNTITPANVSISSLDPNDNSNNNNITSLHQIQSNYEHGSLSNFASIINNSISFHSTNSNSVVIANTLTNTTASYYNSNNNNNLFSQYIPPTGKNKKLKKDFIKNFKFDRKITENQLNSKRDEFWDTAPAFEGKIEIWAALKAAVEAYEQKNFQLAQAIIDSANIILPKGFLNDCYDELGNRYQIPIYVLAKPINLKKSVKSANSEDKNSVGIDEDSSLSPKNIKRSSKKGKKKSKDFEVENEEDEDDEEIDDLNFDTLNIQKTKSNFFKNKLSFSKVKNASNLIGSTSFSFETKKSKQKEDEETSLQRSNSIEEMFQIKIRVSNLNYNENDLKLKVTSNQTVGQLKAQLNEMTNIEIKLMRMFFGGKLMKDRQKLRNHRLRRNVVVQVIVREPKVPDIILPNDNTENKSENEIKIDSTIQQEDSANGEANML